MNRHYIKLFLTDEREGCVLNYDGTTTEIASTYDDVRHKIGLDIHTELLEDLDHSDEAIYGYRIDYTITPIKTGPYK